MSDWNPSDRNTSKQNRWAFALQEVFQYLHHRDQGFAASLLSQWGDGKTLSAKQWLWVENLAERGMERAPSAILDHIVNYGQMHF